MTDERSPSPAPSLADPYEPARVAVAASTVPGTADSVALPNAAAPVPAPAEVSRRRAVAAIIALAASMFLYVSNEIAPLGLISVIAADLGETESTVGLLIAAGAASVIVLSVPLALLAKRVPYRWTLTAAGVLFAGALVMHAASTSFEMLVAGRLLGAAAHALFWAVVTPAAAGMFPVQVRGRMVSRTMIGASAAGVAGLPGLTWIAQTTSWQTSYLLLAALTVLATAAVAVLLPTFRGDEGSTARGELPSWPAFIRVLCVAALSVGSLATVWTYITPYLLQVPGFAPATVPLLLAAGGGVGVVAMALVGRFLDRWPVRSVAVALAMLLVVYLVLGLAGSVPAVSVAMVLLQGFSWSVAVAAMLNWGMRHAPGRTDIAVAAYNSSFNAGNALGPFIGAALLAGAGAAVLPWASAGLVTVALAVVASSRPWHLLERMRRG